MLAVTNNSPCGYPNMSQNEHDIQTGSDGHLQSSDSNQETPVVIVATPEAERNSEDAEMPSMEDSHESLEKSHEHELLEMISNTLQAQNALMAEQKKILEAVASKYKVPQSVSHFR